MHGLVYFFDLVRIHHRDLSAFAQPIDAVGHHLIARIEVTAHADIVAIGHTHGDLALGDRLVGLDQIDVVVLHRRDGHGQRLIELTHLQLDVDELVGKQPAIGIVKRSLGLDGASGGVDGVVQRVELALGQNLLLLTVPQLHRHDLARAQLLCQ